MFSYEFCKIFKNTFFIEHLRMTVSVFSVDFEQVFGNRKGNGIQIKWTLRRFWSMTDWMVNQIKFKKYTSFTIKRQSQNSISVPKAITKIF